uniref:Uncharacterized protein n=1 Tax=Oryza brachyantha TaxID=4533 RepID=J3LA97_ORYBR
MAREIKRGCRLWSFAITRTGCCYSNGLMIGTCMYPIPPQFMLISLLRKFQISLHFRKEILDVPFLLNA